MKIVVCNKFWYSRGGDCIYSMNVKEMMERDGHEVAVFSMEYPDNVESGWEKYYPSSMGKNIFRPFGTAEVRRKFNALLDSFSPDVVHLNNIHSQLSPIIAQIAHERGIRVIWTLHDLKLLCPRYDCLKKGKELCRDCFKGGKFPVLKNSCMKNSIIQSAVAYAEAVRWSRERLEVFTDKFVCPSSFMRQMMLDGGFNPDKLHVLCNPIDVSKCYADSYSTRESYCCYVGRLSHEKGVETLLKAIPPHMKLVVAGSGPLAEKLEALASNNIEFRGHCTWEEVKAIVGKARFMVIPSECYENNPLSVIEALCLGTPVLGARIGGIPELINEKENGMTFESSNENDLAVKLNEMFSTKFEYNNIAKESQLRFNSNGYVSKLLA